MARALARASLDHDLGALSGKRRDDVRDQRDPALGLRGFFGDPDLHPGRRGGEPNGIRRLNGAGGPSASDADRTMFRP